MPLIHPDPEDRSQISKQFLKKLVRSDFKIYYSTPYLNDILYLHYKGFQAIANLQEFTGLKVLYLQGNSISQISGLEKQVQMRSLYLHQNIIKEIRGLETLTLLSNLNLTDNLITKIEGLGTLSRLSNLQLKRNRIGYNGTEDLLGLLQCLSISVLDISDNKIDNQDILEEILMKMPNIAVVYLQNNGFNKKILHYRKTLITKIPTLKYIDDKPIFEDQKRFAQAWARGGTEEERKQRQLYKKQQQEAQIKQHEDFRKMVNLYREEAQKQKQRLSESENQSDSKQQGSLQTYKSPEESEQNSSRRHSKVSESQSEGQSEVKNKCANLDELD